MSKVIANTIQGRSLDPTVNDGLTIVGVLTCNSDVSVGGTLTYEDVTNIDSVGIVTARTGVEVTAGGIDIAAGGINVAGVSTFSGDVNITADELFVADSIKHVGDTDTVISFPTDNAIRFTTAGSQRLQFESGGDISISGTAAGITSAYWDASANSLIFRDNSKAIFGDGSDFAIYHSGSATFLSNDTGTLRIRGSEVRLSNVSNSTYFTGTSGGSAKVYFNDAVKLETTNTGATITGVTTTTQLAVGPGIIQENLFSEASAATGDGNYDIGTRGVTQYYTANTSGTFTINLRWDASTALNTKMNVGSSVVISFYYAQNNTSYYMTDFKIDGSSQTEKWNGGTAPSAGGGSGVDCYTFNILKTANATFTVMANHVNFA